MRSIRALLALCCLSPQASAEVYRFDNQAVPAARTLHAKYLFYATSREDSPGGKAHVPQVAFRGLRLTRQRAPVNSTAFSAVQVGILPWEAWNSLLDPDTFCEMAVDKSGRETPVLVLKDGPGRDQSHLAVVEFDSSSDTAKEVQKTGVYALVVTNCGENAGDALLSGEVSIINPFGFLPANEYYRLPLYGWSLFVHIGLALVWVSMLLAHKSDLAPVHHGIALVALLSVGAAACWWFALSQLNSDGERSAAMELAELLSVLKNLYSFTLVLTAALGLGVIRPELEGDTVKKIACLTGVYSVLAIPKVCIFSIRGTHLPKTSIVVLSIIPVVLVTGILVCWVFRAIAGSMRILREGKHEGMLRVYQRLAILCGAVVLVALVALVAQVMDQPGGGRDWWRYHVLWNDGVAEASSVAGILALMWLWAPQEGGHLVVEMAAVGEDTSLTGNPDAGNDGKDGNGGSFFVVGGDELDDEVDEEEGKFRGGSEPHANKIGAPASLGAE